MAHGSGAEGERNPARARDLEVADGCGVTVGSRDMWNFLEALGQDLKFTLRSLRKNPGFTLLAVIVMALGIGANTAVFSVVNTVLLKPLTYRDPDRIVSLGTIPKNSAPGRGLVSPPDFDDFHDQNSVFEAMARYGSQLPSVIV